MAILVIDSNVFNGFTEVQYTLKVTGSYLQISPFYKFQNEFDLVLSFKFLFYLDYTHL